MRANPIADRLCLGPGCERARKHSVERPVTRDRAGWVGRSSKAASSGWRWIKPPPLAWNPVGATHGAAGIERSYRMSAELQLRSAPGAERRRCARTASPPHHDRSVVSGEPAGRRNRRHRRIGPPQPRTSIEVPSRRGTPPGTSAGWSAVSADRRRSSLARPPACQLGGRRSPRHSQSTRHRPVPWYRRCSWTRKPTLAPRSRRSSACARPIKASSGRPLVRMPSRYGIRAPRRPRPRPCASCQLPTAYPARTHALALIRGMELAFPARELAAGGPC